MATQGTIAKLLVGAGSLVLICAALYHGSGYPAVSKIVAGADMSPLLTRAVQALWLMFSSHLLMVGGISVAAVLKPVPASRLVLVLCGCAAAADAVVLAAFVGVFIGNALLGVAALLILAGATACPRAKPG